MNIIIPLCGIGKRFTDAGYKPKPLIEIFDKKMILHVIDNLKISNDNIFIIYHISLDDHKFSKIFEKYENVHLIPINNRTAGAAETVQFGIKYILSNNLSISKKCLILDCDTIYNINIIKKLKILETNAVVYFKDFESNPIYSYITLECNNITDIREKEKISNNANTGAYFFIDINELYDACTHIVNNNIRFKNEYYMSCVIKYMLHSKQFVGIEIDRKHYTSLGTPEELKKYIDNHISLLFDLDGTLVKSDSIYFKVWSEILLEYNIELTPYMFENYIQGNSDNYVLERLQINTNDISKQKDLLFNKYIDEIEIIDGVYKYIKHYKKLGYSICIVTNCNRETCVNILKHIKIYKYINYIVIGDECDNPKPYPDPYLKAISLLNTTPDKCIIFEDSKPGLLSALNVFPKCIIGVNNGTNENILKELDIKSVIYNYNNVELDQIIKDIAYDIKKMIYNSLKQYDIKDIKLDTTKLKGGYISDVIKVSIELHSGNTMDCVLKYENDYTSSLTKMAYKLGLFDREYYFYESISNYINIHVPKYLGTIKDSNFISKGILLENIHQDGFYLNLDLNKSIDVSLKVIEQCAKFHSLFWNKDLSKSFPNLKKHNDPLFNPTWNDFIQEKWPEFSKKWENIIKPTTLHKLESIVERFSSIQEYLSINNLTLCHGDVKSGNIFYKDGYMPYFIDWQYIANGKGVQDIVFFMIESFSIDTIEKYGDIFKQYYYIKLQEYGVHYSIEDYNKDFEYAICYFPFFVAIWFGTTPTDELIDVSFPFVFIQKLLYFIEKYSTI